jgi:putative cell wall-binding protein
VVAANTAHLTQGPRTETSAWSLVGHPSSRQVLDQAEKTFERSTGRAAKRADDVKDQKIAQLQEKLIKKNEVVAELMEAHVQLKKELGEL